MDSVLGKRVQDELLELSPGKKAKTDEKVKFTNRSGTTFTVHIVPQQMIKSICPICQENTITGNPVCIENRHHVVCQDCAPNIIFSRNSRCPECNQDDTKASESYLLSEMKHYVRELNNTQISCDECTYTGDYSSIESHVHVKPSPSPFWKVPEPDQKHVDISIKKQLPIGRKNKVNYLHNKLKNTSIGIFYEPFIKKLGLKDAEIKTFKDKLRQEGLLLTNDYFKRLLSECFSIRDTRMDLPPIDLELCKRVLQELGYIKLAQSLPIRWPEGI